MERNKSFLVKIDKTFFFDQIILLVPTELPTVYNRKVIVNNIFFVIFIVCALHNSHFILFFIKKVCPAALVGLLIFLQ